MPKKNKVVRVQLSVRPKENGSGQYIVTAEIRSQSIVAEKKWAAGKQPLSYFGGNGNCFKETSFSVDGTGYYTVYVKAEDRTEALKVIKVGLKRRWKWLAIILICLFAVLAAFAVGDRMKGHNSPAKSPVSSQSEPSKLNDSGDGSAVDGNYKGKSHAETLSELEKEQVNVTESVSSSVSFSSGAKGTKGSWMLDNPKKNSVIMQAEIDKDGQMIAKSAAVRPGQHLDSIILSQSVPAGTYKVIAYINYYNPQTEEYMGKAGYQITLVVQ